MRKKTEYGLYLIVFLLAVTTLFLAIRSDSFLRAGSGLQAIHINGKYSMDGSIYSPLSGDTVFDVSDYHTIIIRGHFSQDIPEYMQIMIRFSNVAAELKVNGRTIFTNKPFIGDYCRSPGNGWSAIPSPGVTVEDDVEFLLSNIYKNGNPSTFAHALDEMHIGYESDMGRFILRESVNSILFGFLTIPLGALLFLSGIVIRQLNRERVFSLALFCLSVGIWILADPNFMTFFVDSPAFILTLAQISQFLQLVSITRFICSIAHGKVRSGVGVIHWGIFFLFAAAALCQLLGIRDYYDFTRIFMVFNGVICITMLAALWAEVLKKNDYAKKTLFSILPLGAFSLAEQAAWSFGHYYKGVLTQIGFLIFLSIQAVYTIKDAKALVYRLEQTQRMENELTQNRISIMLSQIQPHFLFNSLMCIRQLCDTDPGRASEALEHFSCFLRGNVDSLSNKGLIPFEREMVHVKDYLYLEKMRFEEKLNIRMEIQETDFMLPPLTLQPIVENAVRYGIVRKKGSGTVTIKTGRGPEGIVVTVTDDGGGFDPEQIEENGRIHVGVINVRKRLEMQCGGFLRIQSKKGAGTKVIIILPQRRELI